MMKSEDYGRALIIDQHATYSVQLLRSIARMGYEVEIFAEPSSPSLHSRFCRKGLLSPSFHDGESFSAAIQSVVQNGNYDVIFLCSEEVLPVILKVAHTSERWRALPLSEPADLKIMLSKHAVLKRVADARVPIPRTIMPADASEVLNAGRDIGFPLLIKGDRGEGSQQVRLVVESAELQEEYERVAAMDKSRKVLPALQEFIAGPKYTVAGLFEKGRPLRVIAYLAELIYPPTVGPTIKGITENPADLLDISFQAFDALRFTGLGNLEFIRDERDGQFKFLEINPRVWGNVGFAEHVGVDLYTPYRQLAEGVSVKPDLRFKTGVRYRRWLNDLRLVVRRPGRVFGFVRDCLNPGIHSDFCWSDLGATLPVGYFLKRLQHSM